MSSFNTIREIRFVRAGEAHLNSTPGRGFWHEPATEDGYDVSLADSFVFIPLAALRRARRKERSR